MAEVTGKYDALITEQHRTCRCGSVYRRTKSMAPSREVNSFECAACGTTLEHWKSAWVPTYRLIIGPATRSSETNDP
jgi:hypothetical protein